MQSHNPASVPTWFGTPPLASFQIEPSHLKRYIDGVGTMSLSITKVDPETGEFAGVFSAIQPSDSDMGGREVVDIKITGDLYGRLEEA